MFKPQIDLVFEEREPHEKGFSAIFERDIKPIIYALEEDRERKMLTIKKRRPYAIAGVAIVVLFFGFIFWFLENSPVVAGDDDLYTLLISVAFIIIFLIYSWAYGFFASKYRLDYKNKILPAIVNFYSSCSYTEDGKILGPVLSDSNLFEKFTDHISEDYISGWYKNKKFAFSEVKLIKGSGKNRTTIFKGVLIFVEMNKKFQGKTLVRADKGSRVNNWMSYGWSKNERVELEDPKFEKLFEVYSTNQVEARYLLTPAFMERLLGLEKAYTGKKSGRVRASFFANSVLIAIPRSGNLFEPRSIRESAVSTEDIRKFLGEMNEVFGVVDILRLYE